MEAGPALREIASAACFNRDSLLMQSSDLDEVRMRVAGVFKPHELSLAGRSNRLFGQLHHARCGNLSLNLLDYGSEVTIDPGRLERFFLLQAPVHGSAEIECGDRRFVSSPAAASFVSPSLPLRMRWGDACPQVILRIERSAVERHCAQHFGEDCARPVEFDPALSLESQAGQCVVQMMSMLSAMMSVPEHPLRHPLAFEQFESTLINALVYGQSNSARSRMRQPAGSLAPYYVRRVEAYIRANLHEPLTIERLAEHAGVSASTLFAGFRSRHGQSPMAYVRQLRLERVRAELLETEASHGSTITDVATRWGFAHLGRFAVDYKRQFGESPSASLRARRGVR